MRTLIKIIAAIVVLVIALLIAIPFLIDPNDYKDEISQQVEKATGRQLNIQGDIGLSVFPWIALDLGQIALSNAEGFDAEHFASVERAQVRIKLLPLLKKEVEMDTIVLDGLVLNLETNQDGVTNWSDLTGDDAEEAVEEAVGAASRPASGKDDGAPALAALSIAGVKLSNANIFWSDASKDENYQIRNLNLDADAIVPNSPAGVKLNFDLISANPEVRAHVTLDTTVAVNLDDQIYTLKNLNLNTLAQSQNMPFSQANISLKSDVNANLESDLVQLNGLVLDANINTPNQEQLVAKLTTDVIANLVAQQVSLNQFAVNGKLSAEAQSVDFKLQSAVQANLATQLYQLDNLNIEGAISGNDLPGGGAPFSLSTDVVANLDDETLTVADLALQIRDLLLNGHLTVNALLSDDLNLKGNIQVKPFNLRKLAEEIALELPEMADTSTLETIALSTELEGSANHLKTQNLNVTLDQSKLTGQFGIRDFSKPAYTFDLVLDQIDADRYLPPPAEDASKQAATPATAAAAGSTELPLETLRDINAKGSFAIGKLKVSGIHSENIKITIDAADGLLKLNPLQADLYEGNYRGNVNLDARGDALKLSIDEKLQGIQAGPLLNDLTGDAKISGVANFAIKLSGQGADVDAITQSLNGTGNFSFKDGAVKGVNIAEAIRQAQAALTRQSLPESSAPVATDFSELTGSFTVTNGIIANEDLAMQSPLLRLNGAGTIDLPEEQLDYGLRVSVVGTLEGQGGQELADLRGLTIPVRIRGSFDNPRPSVDLAAILKERVTGEVKERAEQEIRERLGDDIGNLLGGALGGSRATEEAAEPAEGAENTEENAASEEKAPSLEEQLKDDVKNRLRSLF